MIEAFKEAYTELNQLTKGLASTFLMIPVVSLGMSLIFKAVKLICNGEYISMHSEQSQRERIRKETPKVNLSKSETDSDLKKYFDYNVNR